MREDAGIRLKEISPLGAQSQETDRGDAFITCKDVY